MALLSSFDIWLAVQLEKHCRVDNYTKYNANSLKIKVIKNQFKEYKLTASKFSELGDLFDSVWCLTVR